MRKLRLFIALLVALAVAWLFDDSGPSSVRVITGDVLEWQAGRSISVVNQQTDPQGVRIDVRTAKHDEDRGAIRTGARVAVSYKHVEEQYPVAVRVQVLDPR